MSTTRPFHLPQVSPPPHFAPCSSQLAVALHLSRTSAPERIEREGKRERETERNSVLEGDKGKRERGNRGERQKSGGDIEEIEERQEKRG